MFPYMGMVQTLTSIFSKTTHTNSVKFSHYIYSVKVFWFMLKKLYVSITGQSSWLGSFKPSLTLDRKLIPLGLWELNTLHLIIWSNMNCLKLSKFRIFVFNLFYSRIEEGKREFSKNLCIILRCGMFSEFLVLLILLVNIVSF